MTKILLADDHELVREGLKAILSTKDNVEIVGEAVNGQEAVNMAESLKPDLILMDITMPLMDGIEASQKIRQQNADVRIVVLTGTDSIEYFLKGIGIGITGYVLKDAASVDLLQAIETVMAGQAYLSPAMTKAVIRYRLGQKDPATARVERELTPRETEILKLLAEGMSTQEIADKLVISLKTVQTHRAHIMEKLNLSNPSQLVKYALKKGIISLES